MRAALLLLLLALAPIALADREDQVPAETTHDSPVVHYVPLARQQPTLIPHKYIDLPVVGKCCNGNEVLHKNEDDKPATCARSNSRANEAFWPLFTNYNETGIHNGTILESEFVAIVGDPCHGKRYVFEPSKNIDEEYYLLLNGSIYAPFDKTSTMLMPGIDYCMEFGSQKEIEVFACFLPGQMEKETVDVLHVLHACGLLVSVPFLLMTIAAYAMTPRLMDVQGKALCRYCASLALAFVSLASVQLGTNYISDEICIAIAFVIQFSFVASFLWLNVMCMETYLQVRRHLRRSDEYTYTPVPTTMTLSSVLADHQLHDHHRRHEPQQREQLQQQQQKRMHPDRLFFYYSLWAWGPPVFLILLSVFMDLSPIIPVSYAKPKFGRDSCWFHSDRDAMPYFYAPMSLLMCINVGLFAVTAVGITRYQRELDLRRLARNQESDRQEQRLFRRLKRVFLVCMGLFFLMGVNWAMELISWWAGVAPLAFTAFDLVNVLHGVIVFGLFVMRRPVRDIVWARIQKLRGIGTPPEPHDINGSMALYLLPVVNDPDDTLPRQRVS